MRVSLEDADKISNAGLPRTREGFVRATARRGILLAAGLLVGLGFGLVAVLDHGETYLAEARVLVAASPVRTSGDATDALDAQRRLILSRDVARTAIADLGLNLDDFSPHGGAGLMSRLMLMAGLSRPVRDVPEEDRLLAAFSGRLSVRAAGGDRQVAIGFRAEDPALAAKAANEVARLYVDMYAQANANAGTSTDIRILAQATAPEPRDAQGRRSILAGFALAGFGLSAGLAGLREWRARRAQPKGSAEPPDAPVVPGEVRLMTRVATAVQEDRIAIAPQIPAEAVGADVPNFAADAPVEETDALVSRIISDGPTNYAQRILVTHVEANVDCALSALALARTLGLHGRTILVGIGAGDRAQAVHGRRPAAGLGDLLQGTASFSEVIHRDAGSRLHILPSGQVAAPVDANFDLILDALSQTYDFVVLSATLDPEQPARDLAISLAPEADFVVLASSGQASNPDLATLKADLLEAGAGDVLAVKANMRPADEAANAA